MKAAVGREAKMNADLSRTQARFVRTIELLAACLLLAGCDEGPTAPATPNISGNWLGTYRPGIGTGFDPCDNGGPATATFSQDGSQIRGILTTQDRSFAEGDFVGEIHGDQLRGTLTSGGTARNVRGSASAVQITLSLDLPFCSGNTIELHR
jgi:hypothetical protein